MTNAPTQADRDAAARWAKSNSRHAQAANMQRGSCDTSPLVQAFALHAQRAREQALDEAAGVADSWTAADYSEECNIMADSIAREIRALKEGRGDE